MYNAVFVSMCSALLCPAAVLLINVCSLTERSFTPFLCVFLLLTAMSFVFRSGLKSVFSLLFWAMVMQVLPLPWLVSASCAVSDFAMSQIALYLKRTVAAERCSSSTLKMDVSMFSSRSIAGLHSSSICSLWGSEQRMSMQTVWALQLRQSKARSISFFLFHVTVSSIHF